MSVRSARRAAWLVWRSGVIAWRFCYRVVESFLDCGGLQHAASIAFFGILSLLPFTLLAVSLLARLAAELPMAPANGEPVEQVLDPIRHAIPFLGGGLHDLIVRLASRKVAYGWASAGALAFAASAGFTAVSAGINAALETKRQRHFIITRVMVAGLVILMVTALFLWHVGLRLTEVWADSLGVAVPIWLREAALVQQGIEIAVLAVGFYVMVKMLATERYPRRMRWIGAAVFAVFFEAARTGFGVYLQRLTRYDDFYGVAGAFFGIALWLYVAAIVLVGSCTVIRTLFEMREERATV